MVSIVGITPAFFPVAQGSAGTVHLLRGLENGLLNK
jgi:hypothetical protein